MMQRNIDRNLNLLLDGKIPNDANLVIIASPQSSYTEEEVILLQDYLNRRNGRVVIF